MGGREAVELDGAIKLMPGTGFNPALRRIDVDVDPAKVTGGSNTYRKILEAILDRRTSTATIASDVPTT